ncbi:MAG: CotH kinase family protein, partial [Melioribacteraceae bacterium]|nr:CotH kinase family protein [Melioribacteraceae bacterium]
MRVKVIFFILSYLLISINANSQNDESWKVYNDSEVAVVKITIDQSNLQYMYDNPQSDSMHLVKVSFKNAYINEVIDSVGFRIRGNTSRESFKKSFKLSFNTFVDGGEFYSLDKINLNGEHNDPSIVRSKLSWDFFNSIGLISSRAAHTAVYINEKYYGLYISVEHIDDEFINKNFDDDSGNLWKCLYGSDLVYLGEDPDLYKFESVGGDSPYSLVTNEELNDYSQLSRLIGVINNSSDEQFEQSIEAILDVNSVLKYLATNVAIGGWDDYWSLSNNFYLYYDPTNDKFTLIPYDYDNTFGISFGFGIDWETVNPYTFGQVVSGPRPLVERLLSFPKYRNLYTHFLE